jgi:hypothetical protein
MNKAIIVEVSSRHLIVLAEGGEFKKVKNTNPAYAVGQEISLPVLKEKKDSIFSIFINWKTLTAAALAIFLLFFQILAPMSGPGAYAYVGMNMDPSLELKIDEDMKVLDIFSYNEQGHAVLEHMDEWKNKEIAYVTNLIFETCEDLGYLKTKEEVLITTTLSEDIPEDKEKEMKELVNKVMTQTAKKKSVEMTTIVMSSKERERAKKMKISPGHYAIYTAAKNSGINITPKEVSNKTIEEISKKVGPIKELLEHKNEIVTASTNKEVENQVYEPPLPILDDKKEEEKAEKEKPALPVHEKIKKDYNEKSAKPQNSHSVIAAAEPQKEEKAHEPEEKEKANHKNPPMTVAVPEKESAAKPPAKDIPLVTPPKEEKPKEEKPKVDPPSSDSEEPVQQEPDPSTEPDWIYIEIILDNLIFTVKIKSNSHLLKEELTKHALALINQNHLLVKNQAVITSTEEISEAQVIEQLNKMSSECEKEIKSTENHADISTQKAS